MLKRESNHSLTPGIFWGALAFNNFIRISQEEKAYQDYLKESSQQKNLREPIDVSGNPRSPIPCQEVCLPALAVSEPLPRRMNRNRHLVLKPSKIPVAPLRE